MTTKTTTTLKEACEAYVAHMKEKGQSASTLGTIQRTLALLLEEMGEDKEVGKILPVHVDKFFKSEKATQQPGKDGMKPRAQASVLQIRRITRMALVHWHEQGLIAKVPVPGSEKHLVEKAEQRAAERTEAEAKPKKGRKVKSEPEAAGSYEPQADAAPSEQV
jgi:hypothetical protein